MFDAASTPFVIANMTSRPFARFGVWPVGGRSTAIKLRSGGVWVLASTPLDAETKAKLQELGPVKYASFICRASGATAELLTLS